MNTVGVVIGTFGDRSFWKPLAERAIESIHRQIRQPDDFVWCHASDLHTARNQGAATMDTDWLVFLDADDELDRRYIDEMLAGSGDVRQPATLGFYEDGREDDHPVVLQRKALLDGNYIVVGAMQRANMFFNVGGFRELPMYEDWDLWLRLEESGAEFTCCPTAIYRVGVRQNSRNNQPQRVQLRTYSQIRKDAFNRREIRHAI